MNACDSKKIATGYLLAVFLSLSLPSLCHAQSLGNHYVLGAEGIKDGFPPPVGLYLRNYTYFYSSNRLNDAQGNALNLNFHLTVVADATRFTYVTPYQVAGGNYGMGVVLPYVYASATIGSTTQSHFGLGDVYFEPINLGWRLEHFDVMTTAGFFAPTGNFNPANASSPGDGFWTGMYTLGATYYPDKDKLWNVAVLNRLEFSSKQEQTHIQPGYGESFEWGAARSFIIGPQEKGPPDGILDIGAAGYCNWQFTQTTGPSYPLHTQDVAAVGPEVAYTMPKVNTLFSLRYEPEFEAKARPQGTTLNLTITTKLW
jgi:hypothetical protein